MSRYYFIISIGIVVICAVLIAANNETILESRCFQFTWLGPRWNNDSIFLNATCQDATRLSSGVPCVEPLVVSSRAGHTFKSGSVSTNKDNTDFMRWKNYDGTWPDVNYIWRNHLGNASCLLANNDVCAQYTYYFDGRVDNSTYLCTRAVDTNGVAITNGCYEQRNGSFVTKACFCRSVPGGRPCNKAFLTNINTIFVILVAIVMIYNSNFVK